MNDIKYITLDAMDTLIFLKERPAEIYTKVLKSIYSGNIEKLSQNPKIFSDYWGKAIFKIKDYISGNRDKFSYPNHRCGFWGVLFEEMFEDLSVPSAYLDEFCRLVFLEFIQIKYWKIEKTFFEFSYELKKRKIGLSVISNWDERLPILLKDLKIDDHFDWIITSHEAGFEKPSAEIFSFFFQRLQKKENSIKKENLLHIGDKYEEDYLGAQKYGFFAFHYTNRKNLIDNSKINYLIDIINKF